ncbi:MAG: metallophosphoesterase family protein [Eubacteriales bacterium]
MSKTISVRIRDKIATADISACIVCGNSDYVIDFDFDEEWEAYNAKTARFIYGDGIYTDVVFDGNQCNVPVVSNTYSVTVGVYAGNLHTTTPAYIPAKKSILCGKGTPEAPNDDVYSEIMARLNTVPEQVISAVNDYLQSNPFLENDPTVPGWAKQPQKPSYSALEVGADPSGTAASEVNEHNTGVDSHGDIRLLISGLTDRLNALVDSDDTTLDQLSEIVAYIKYNRDLISSITTDKVSVSDIVNDLVTNVANKPLSAAQGVALKTLIDTLSTNKLDADQLTAAVNTAISQAKESGEFDGADGKSAYDYAVDGGYTGTTEEFSDKLAGTPDYVRTEAERVAENILSIDGEGGEVSGTAYTNLLPEAEAIDSTDPYNGVGYKNGYYASSASPYEGADSACVLTGLIKYDGSYSATELPSIYVKCATIDTSNSHVRFQLWSDSKGYINGISYGTHITVDALGDGYYKLTFASNIRDSFGAFGYIRMSLVGTGENLIVTVGEAIEESAVATVDAPPLNIAFITDLHYNETYADGLKHAAQGLSVIKETAQIDAVVFGGDYVNTNSGTELAKSHISVCKHLFANAAGDSVEIWLRGNHDNVPYPDTDESDPRISRMECFNRTGRKQYNRNGYVSNLKDPGGNYGYIDFEASKIRLICLNTVDNDHFGIGSGLTDAYHVSATQLEWIANTALDFTDKDSPAEWGIVVVSHVPVYSGNWMNTHSYTDANGTVWAANVVNVKNLIMAYVCGETFSASVDGVNVSADYSALTDRAKLLCAISGHQHALTSYTDAGWLTIGCPNASHLRTNEAGYAQDPDIDGNSYGTTAQEKALDSERDTAFTVITIDRAGSKVYAWCYGAGYDRAWSI